MKMAAPPVASLRPERREAGRPAAGCGLRAEEPLLPGPKTAVLGR
jgi:hypothetical protein